MTPPISTPFEPYLPLTQSPFNVHAVLERCIQTSHRSWEQSTLSEALLELHTPSLSIFGADPFPKGQIPAIEDIESIPALCYIKPFIQTDNENVLIDSDGCVGDPASLGIAALIIGRSLLSSSSPAYTEAALRQAKYVLSAAPRFANNAISHREAAAELWSDFVYMAPPFLAYLGVVQRSKEMVGEAVRQCLLQEEILQVRGDDERLGKGLWKHIVVAPGGGGDEDPGLWSTGNGWAASGMCRVLATLEHWPSDDAEEDVWSGEKAKLVKSIKAIVDGAATALTDPANGLLRNHLENEAWPGDAAGTAMIAAATYRAAVIAPQTFGHSYTQLADRWRDAVSRVVDNDTGIVEPVCNPYDWKDKVPLKGGSPEAQAMVVLLYCAYRDYLSWAEEHKP
ncbi:hypothetical protein MMC25_002540 [Agyrium rufum]|nr:hypothetical protein [Agyrium rufum]